MLPRQPYCTNKPFEANLQRYYRNLLHEIALQPSPQVGILPSTTLCVFCQHLRLGNLLCCVDQNSWPMESTLIKLCELRDVSNRMAACSFCHLVLRAGLPYGHFSGMQPLPSPEEGFISFQIRDAALGLQIHGPQAWTGGGTTHFRSERAGQVISEERTAEQPAVPLGTTHGDFDWGVAAQWLADCNENRCQQSPCRPARSRLLIYRTQLCLGPDTRPDQTIYPHIQHRHPPHPRCPLSLRPSPHRQRHPRSLSPPRRALPLGRPPLKMARRHWPCTPPAHCGRSRGR